MLFMGYCVAMTNSSPLFIANQLGLDFLNTAFGTGGAAQDLLVDDAAVLAWLDAAGLPALPQGAPRGLARLARELRAAGDRLVRDPSAAMDADLALLDRIVERGRPLAALEWDDGQGRLRQVSRRRDDSCDSLLEPVASALVELLTAGDPARVRECEAHDCTLLFEDLTRARRRRWCSMALCGNRMKVAAFRSRQQQDREAPGGAGA